MKVCLLADTGACVAGAMGIATEDGITGKGETGTDATAFGEVGAARLAAGEGAGTARLAAGEGAGAARFVASEGAGAARFAAGEGAGAERLAAGEGAGAVRLAAGEGAGGLAAGAGRTGSEDRVTDGGKGDAPGDWGRGTGM